MLPHDPRPAHPASIPLLITSRLRPGLPSLRRGGEAARVRAALANTNRTAQASSAVDGQRPRAPRFQVVHHSIQSNHLHLIVEAKDRAALTAGMRGLLVRIARSLNQLWGRSGSVFADRFHERELRNPRQVRNALVYVLQNLRKHGIFVEGPDPLSSGPEFDGWRLGGGAARAAGGRCGQARASGGGAGNAVPFQRAARIDVPTAQTWLLNTGWARHGLIDLSEHPRSRRE